MLRIQPAFCAHPWPNAVLHRVECKDVMAKAHGARVMMAAGSIPQALLSLNVFAGAPAEARNDAAAVEHPALAQIEATIYVQLILRV